MTDRTCSVEGCERPLQARSWCHMHYMRWWLNGTDDIGPAGYRLRGICSAEECGKPHYAKGYCRLHYRRLRAFGELGPNERTWRRKDDPGYAAAHHRIWNTRGSAKSHICEHCGKPAAEWAYDHLDPDERKEIVHDRLLPYSLTPEHYMPLCRSCHHLFDNEHARR